MRLALALLLTAAILALADREIPRVVTGRAAIRSAIASGEEMLGRKVNRQFLDLRTDRIAAIERAYRRWPSIPDTLGAGAVRVGLIGTSPAPFSIVPPGLGRSPA